MTYKKENSIWTAVVAVFSCTFEMLFNFLSSSIWLQITLFFQVSQFTCLKNKYPKWLGVKDYN